MNILPLSNRLLKYLKTRNLAKRFEKQKLIFETNPFHPSLHTEILEPKHLKIYSFRVGRQYRAIFIYNGDGDIEIIDINNHYR
jgi:plasmid maintenance system killer protein